MAEQRIAFVRVNYGGTQTAAASPSGYAADADRVKWQRKTRDNPERQLAFGIGVIREKLKAALATLNSEFPESPAREKAIAATLIGLDALDSGTKTLSLLLATEGKAAFAYWSAWRTLTLNWKATSRHPILDEWKAFHARSSVLTGAKHKNIRASNPINAMLNYAYAVLLTDRRIKAIADGYDPMIGILHDQRHYAKERTPSRPRHNGTPTPCRGWSRPAADPRRDVHWLGFPVAKRRRLQAQSGVSADDLSGPPLLTRHVRERHWSFADDPQCSLWRDQSSHASR